jgi:hypothetical protein
MQPLYWMHSELPGAGYDVKSVSFADFQTRPDLEHGSPVLPLLLPLPPPLLLPLVEPLLDPLPPLELLPVPPVQLAELTVRPLAELKFVLSVE